MTSKQIISEIRNLLDKLEQELVAGTVPNAPVLHPTQPSSEPSTTRSVLTLRNGENLKWQPGHYLHFTINPQVPQGATKGEDFYSIMPRVLNEFTKAPKLKGIKLTIPWVLIEKDRNVFDWSGLDWFLSKIPTGKYVHLDLKDRIFAPAWYHVPRGWFPGYLNTPTTQRFLYTDKDNRIMPRLDSQEYYNEYIRVLRAMGTRYSDHPKVVAFSYLNETAQSAPSNKVYDAFTGAPVDAQYIVNESQFKENYRINIDRIYQDIKDFWKGVTLYGSWNYYPGNKSQYNTSLQKLLTQPRNAMSWPDSPVGMWHAALRVRGNVTKGRILNLDRDNTWDYVISVDGADYSEYTQVLHQIDFTIPDRFRPLYYAKGWNNNKFKDGDIIINSDPFTGKNYKVGSKVKLSSGTELVITEIVNPVGWGVEGNAASHAHLWTLGKSDSLILMLNEDATNMSGGVKNAGPQSDWDGKKHFGTNHSGLVKTYTYKTADLLINLYNAHTIIWPPGIHTGEYYTNYTSNLLYPVLDAFSWKINETPPKGII